jgi:hypothetical protein
MNEVIDSLRFEFGVPWAFAACLGDLAVIEESCYARPREPNDATGSFRSCHANHVNLFKPIGLPIGHFRWCFAGPCDYDDHNAGASSAGLDC